MFALKYLFFFFTLFSLFSHSSLHFVLPLICPCVIRYWQIVSTPAPHGATLTSFLATPTKTEFELVGAIANNKPSGVFRTGWSTNETVSSAINSPCGSVVTVNLGVSIEPLGNITNVGAMPDRTVHVAKNIALDLFNYMQSFDSGGGGAGNMVVPKNVFDRWMARFESKFRLDPNFFNKN